MLRLDLFDFILDFLDGILQVKVVLVVKHVLLVECQLPARDGVALKSLVRVVPPGHHVKGVSQDAWRRETVDQEEMRSRKENGKQGLGDEKGGQTCSEGEKISNGLHDVPRVLVPRESHHDSPLRAQGHKSSPDHPGSELRRGEDYEDAPQKKKRKFSAISLHLLGFQVQMTFGDLKGSEGLLHLNKLLLLWLQTLWSGWPKEREKKGKPLGYEPSDHLSSWG